MNRNKILSIMTSALIAGNLVVQPIGEKVVFASNNTNLLEERENGENNKIKVFKIIASSEENRPGNEEPASLAIDNNPNTFWHTAWDGSGEKAHNLTLDLNGIYTINKFDYLPRPAGEYGERNGNITQYTLQVSLDGEDFIEVASGNWSNDGELKIIEFDDIQAKYVRLVANETVYDKNDGKIFASATEVGVYVSAILGITGVEVNGNKAGDDIIITAGEIQGAVGEIEYRYTVYVPAIGWT